jgi:hypothetical protein
LPLESLTQILESNIVSALGTEGMSPRTEADKFISPESLLISNMSLDVVAAYTFEAVSSTTVTTPDAGNAVSQIGELFEI